jgi:hypothetical protein
MTRQAFSSMNDSLLYPVRSIQHQNGNLFGPSHYRKKVLIDMTHFDVKTHHHHNKMMTDDESSKKKKKNVAMQCLLTFPEALVPSLLHPF